ncbi:hemin-degrading factor [Celerinatantimonas sp. MCCC 1A17872]|uniref:hemin-degrading factor n=1 Tax=Celerinatantimonas sp. MCCC 1A17872 TaxID=3177514 RepID=UPI0038C62ED5
MLNSSNLYQRMCTLQTQQPKLRARRLAQSLNVSEAQLIHCRHGHDSWQLTSNFQALINEINQLGEVMALTRNEQAVHERHGRYHDLHQDGEIGVILGPEIDLRIFFNHWRSAYWVDDEGRQSIQIFDATGQAVHKIYQTDKTNSQAWDNLISRYKTNELQDLAIHPVTSNAVRPINEAFNRETFCQDWANLQEVHDYHLLLQRHQLSRTQALAQIDKQWATKLHIDALAMLLTQVSQNRCPIMIFVGNRGCVQIYTGPIAHIKPTANWLNVLDPGFNLHLNLAEIDQLWMLKRPTVDGNIHAIEAFNADGESIVTFFGKRKPGQPQLKAWQQLCEQLCLTHPADTN